DDWLGCFEVGSDEDGNLKYGPVAPSCSEQFEVTTPSGRKFTRGFKTKDMKRKLSGKFSSEDILKFDNFLD
ncbi:hypothetical protein Tco_0549774, partial [Tanacetum coccineum]